MSTDELRVGWIGCGRMGSAMAERLIRSGVDVSVTNRTRAKAEALGDLGATVVEAPRDLATCDVVFTMVTADAQLSEVVIGEYGVLSDPSRSPRIIVDCSTVSTTASSSVRQACGNRGTDFLAAPVSGNPKVVAAGKLTLAASGSRVAFEVVRPLIEHIGRVTYVGDAEVARLVKICHNVFLGIVTEGLAEVTVLAERGGIDRSAFLEFINNSIMGSTFTRYKTPALVSLDFTPTFTPVLLRKDFDIGMAEARRLDVPMPVAALVTELIQSVIGAGYVNEDFAILLARASPSRRFDHESRSGSCR
ncbi:MAG: NAD(P)-dependent oxidoreductase [Acidimicrobiales bacterium]